MSWRSTSWLTLWSSQKPPAPRNQVSVLWCLSVLCLCSFLFVVMIVANVLVFVMILRNHSLYHQFSSCRTFISRRYNSLRQSRVQCSQIAPVGPTNSDVFSLRWNCPSVGVASLNDWGSEFQLVATNTAKLHGPYVDVLVRRTARSPQAEECKQLQPETVETGSLDHCCHHSVQCNIK